MSEETMTETLVATRDDGVTVVVAQPGQAIPNAEELRALGVTADQIVPLSASPAAPLTAAQKAAEAAADLNVAWVDDKAVERARRGAAIQEGGSSDGGV